MNSVKRFLTAQADLHSSSRLNHFLSGVALVAISVKSERPVQKWFGIITGSIFILKGITGKPIAQSLLSDIEEVKA